MLGGMKAVSGENNSKAEYNVFDTFDKNYEKEKIMRDGMSSASVDKTPNISFDKESLLNGIIISEVLGSPKSKRRRQRLANRRQFAKGNE